MTPAAPKPDRTGTAAKSASEPQAELASPSPSPANGCLKNKKKSERGEAAADGGGAEEATLVMTGRERLKRHRMEMAGRVWIPEKWGQEGRLREWIDSSSAVERSLVPKGLVSARAALVEECRRTNYSGSSPQIKNPC